MGPRNKNAASELLPGPFLKHELRSLLRSRRAFWLLVLAVAASGSFALLSWPRADQAAEASLESRGTFFAFALAQLTLTIFMIPAFTAGAFAGEREHGTYDLLYSTPVSPVSILVSKVLASTGYVGIVLTASAPAVCVLYLLGGIDFGAILKGYAVTFAAVFVSGLACLLKSQKSLKTAQAAARGVLSVVFWNGGLAALILLVVSLMLVPIFPELLASAARMVSCLSPYTGLYEAVWPDISRGMCFPGLDWLEPWMIFSVYTALVSFRLFRKLLKNVHAVEPIGSLSRSPSEPATFRLQHSVNLALSTQSFLHLGTAGFPMVRNPVFLREIRSEFFGKSDYRLLMFWIPISLAPMLVIPFRGQLIAGIPFIYFFAMIFTTLLVPGAMAGSFRREMSQGNFDFLRSTLLTPREIVGGKFLAGAFSSLGPSAAAGWVIVPVIVGSGLGAAVACFALLLVPLFFTTAMTILAAVITRRGGEALLLSYGSAVGLFVLFPILLQPGASLPLFLHPYWALVDIVNRLRKGQSTGLEAAALCLLLYGSATFLLWLFSCACFERYRLRADDLCARER